MGGVGYKLALLLPGLFHRTNRQGGQKEADKEETHHSQGPHQKTGEHQVAQRSALPAAVGKRDARCAAGAVLHLKAQAQPTQHALAGTGRQDLLDGLGGHLVGYGHLAAVVDGRDPAVLRHRHGDVIRPVVVLPPCQLSRLLTQGIAVLPRLFTGDAQRHGAAAVHGAGERASHAGRRESSAASGAK